MKTKELVRQLQREDPSGELEVTVHGDDIYFAGRQPAYWDGPHFILHHDPAKVGKCYSIVGGKINYEGDKVRLHTTSWSDVVLHNPDAPIEVSAFRADRWQGAIEAERELARSIKREVELHSAAKAWAELEGKQVPELSFESLDGRDTVLMDEAEDFFRRVVKQRTWETADDPERAAWVALAKHVALEYGPRPKSLLRRLLNRLRRRP